MKLFWYVWEDGSVSILPANDGVDASLLVDELSAVDPAELRLIELRGRFRLLKRLAQIDGEDPGTGSSPGDCVEAGQSWPAEGGPRKARKLKH